MTWLDRSLVTGPRLALVLSDKEFRKALKQCGMAKVDGPAWIKSDHADATVHWMEPEGMGLVCIIALRAREGITGIQIASMLVHEAVHVFQRYCAYIGESDPSAEFEAYSIQNITQNLLVAYSKKTQ